MRKNQRNAVIFLAYNIRIRFDEKNNTNRRLFDVRLMFILLKKFNVEYYEIIYDKSHFGIVRNHREKNEDEKFFYYSLRRI